MIFRNLKNPLLSKTFRSQIPSFGVLNHDKFQKKVEGKGKVTKFLYEFWEILYQGTWDQCVDAKMMCKYTFTQKKTAFMLSEITRIRKDLIKFIPFSFFLIVPGAELLLPPYLYLFPNAFPTTYLFDDQLAKRYITRDRKQMNSYRYLFQLMKQRIPSIENIRNNQDYNAKGLQELVLKHSHLFMTKLDYRDFNSEQLVHLCKFLGMEFFRGTYTIMKLTKLFVNLPVYFTNLFYWITRNPERRPLNSVLKNWNSLLPFPLEDLKKALLLMQIKSHLRKLERQDKAFRLNGFGDNKYESIRQFARERGIPALVMQKENPEQDFEYSKKQFKRDYIDFINKEQVFENLKIWYAVLYYERYHNRIVEEYEERVRKHLLH
ncbi:unnamed protein product [Paramecium primaurelia]|uniref:Letm1 RBD domain-containing protein n=2 Tax=Paramecium TaxID=5884 RepID=A0A8S1S6N3_9CILI|nr:unnamed protein product [Paramecium primaurelia]CAD8135283.1 unnamed protein product [Paramecium pentaurelia]